MEKLSLSTFFRCEPASGNYEAAYRYLFVLVAYIVVFLWCSDTYSATRTIAFTNKTGQDVDDLHVVFSQKTTVTNNPFGNDKTLGANDVTHNFWGMTIKGDPEGSVKLSFSSTTEVLTIGKWWWTAGGNAREDGTIVGREKTDGGGTNLSFLDQPATGDGAILVSINGDDSIFTSTEGFSAEQSANAFDLFLAGLIDNGFPLIHSALLTNTTAQFVGNLLGDPDTELRSQILHQDSTQQLTLTSIPEPSTLLLLGSGLASLIGFGRKRLFKNMKSGSE